MSLLPMAEYLGVSPGTNPSQLMIHIVFHQNTIKATEASWQYVAKPNRAKP